MADFFNRIGRKQSVTKCGFLTKSSRRVSTKPGVIHIDRASRVSAVSDRSNTN